MSAINPALGDGEILVEVRAESVNYGNLAFVGGEPFLARPWSGLPRPKDGNPGGSRMPLVSATRVKPP